MRVLERILVACAVCLNFYGSEEMDIDARYGAGAGMRIAVAPAQEELFHPPAFFGGASAHAEGDGGGHSQAVLSFRADVERAPLISLEDDRKACLSLAQARERFIALCFLELRNFTLCDRSFILRCKWSDLQFLGKDLFGYFNELKRKLSEDGESGAIKRGCENPNAGPPSPKRRRRGSCADDLVCVINFSE